VLGRNLEALVGRAQEMKADMKDEFVSVEHLLAAFVDDARFGQGLLEGAGLTRSKLEAAIKEVGDARGTCPSACGVRMLTCFSLCSALSEEYLSS
jgi:ATP-dependent Clp protease ATP-binding subunit ClpA